LNRRQFAALLSFVIAVFCLLAACTKPQSSVVAISHVTVIDMTGAPPALDQTVLIDKAKIIALGPSNSVSIPYGAKVLDARGKFLIPGLSDMHVHLTGAGEPNGSRKFILPLLVANGITTVRDMGGSVELLKGLREEIADLKMFPNGKLDPIFAATVQSVEEAIVNAMVAAETMTGIENHRVIALDHEKLRAILKKYNRLNP